MSLKAQGQEAGGIREGPEGKPCGGLCRSRGWREHAWARGAGEVGRPLSLFLSRAWRPPRGEAEQQGSVGLERLPGARLLSCGDKPWVSGTVIASSFTNLIFPSPTPTRDPAETCPRHPPTVTWASTPSLRGGEGEDGEGTRGGRRAIRSPGPQARSARPPRLTTAPRPGPSALCCPQPALAAC